MDTLVIALCVVLTNILSAAGQSSESMTIECGQSITGILDYTSPWAIAGNDALSLAINFTNIEPQNVTFTTCDSEFFAGLKLKNSTGHYIHSQSTNQCDGCDCDSSYCTGETSLYQTTFTMDALPAGNYTIEITNECGPDDTYFYGEFNLFVMCDVAGPGMFLYMFQVLNVNM